MGRAPKGLGPPHACDAINFTSSGLTGAAVPPYDHLGVWGVVASLEFVFVSIASVLIEP